MTDMFTLHCYLLGFPNHVWSEEINCNTLTEKGLNLQYQL